MAIDQTDKRIFQSWRGNVQIIVNVSKVKLKITNFINLIQLAKKSRK